MQTSIHGGISDGDPSDKCLEDEISQGIINRPIHVEMVHLLCMSCP